MSPDSKMLPPKRRREAAARKGREENTQPPPSWRCCHLPSSVRVVVLSLFSLVGWWWSFLPKLTHPLKNLFFDHTKQGKQRQEEKHHHTGGGGRKTAPIQTRRRGKAALPTTRRRRQHHPKEMRPPCIPPPPHLLGGAAFPPHLKRCCFPPSGLLLLLGVTVSLLFLSCACRTQTQHRDKVFLNAETPKTSKQPEQPVYRKQSRYKTTDQFGRWEEGEALADVECWTEPGFGNLIPSYDLVKSQHDVFIIVDSLTSR